MANVIKYRCPQCGSTDGLLKIRGEPNPENKLAGAVCANCGRPFSDEELKAQAGAIIDNLVKGLRGKLR